MVASEKIFARNIDIIFCLVGLFRLQRARDVGGAEVAEVAAVAEVGVGVVVVVEVEVAIIVVVELAAEEVADLLEEVAAAAVVGTSARWSVGKLEEKGDPLLPFGRITRKFYAIDSNEINLWHPLFVYFLSR